MVSENGGVDVLAVMDADGRAVALAADEMKTSIARDQWQAHLAAHDAARAAVAELIEAADGLSPWRVGAGNSLDHAALHEAQKRLAAALAKCRA